LTKSTTDNRGDGGDQVSVGAGGGEININEFSLFLSMMS